jgi:hypothetical protein
MYTGNPYQLQQALEELHRHGRNQDQSAARAALRLYRRTRREGWLVQFWTIVTGQDQHLLDLRHVEANLQIDNRYDVGRRTVALCQIRGSEGRCQDFDASFRPLQPHCATRWLAVATARKMGMALPPVSLIQVGDVYFVRDGHHRVSVARALGQAEIEAEVTVWQVAGAWTAVPICPVGIGPIARLAMGQVGLLLVALGGRLVARGLPPYRPGVGEASGKQSGTLMA